MTRATSPLRRLWLGQVRAIARRRSVILGYHGVARASRRHDLSMLLVSPTRFRAQIELLLDAGFRFTTVAQLAELANGHEPPPGYAAISFDDGMRNNLTVAQPILRSYGIAATVYVTIGFISATSPWVGARGDNRMLSEPELRELAGAGWELGAHTLTHPDLSRLDYRSCRREIEASREALEQIGGVPVRTFAYPFGHRGPAAVAAARDSGLIAAVATGRGSWNPYELQRAMIGAIDPTPVVVLKLADRYEPLLELWPVDALRRASKRARARARAHPQR
ncbi:MAG TPA: polysaccharide deacetylase family protein [Solirubrobacteraceae bacterium]|nr:polysaccharide deacetylase family protein [Solirubrobacteraceae bacterium]